MKVLPVGTAEAEAARTAKTARTENCIFNGKERLILFEDRRGKNVGWERQALKQTMGCRVKKV